MIVKQIHLDSIEIHDHTVAEIFLDANSKAQAAILARIAKAIGQWQMPSSWDWQCQGIAADLRKISMDKEVKAILQTLIDNI